jgi:hypothetical protein
MSTRFGWQFVRDDGSPVVVGSFDAAYTFHDGVANVRIGNKWGTIDRDAKFVIDPILDQVWPSFHERAGFQIGGRWGFVTPRGDVAIEPTYLDVKNFTRHTALTIVRAEKGWGAMRTDGALVVPTEMSGIAIGPDGWIRILKDGLVGFCDGNGKPVIDCKFRGVDHFHEDRAVVNVEGKLGYIDRRGEIVIATEYDSATDFSCGLALVKRGDRFGFVDASGAIVIPFELTSATSFAEGRAFAWRAGSERAECIDTKGARVFDATFEHAVAFDHGTARVGKGPRGPFGLCDQRGETVLPIEYDVVDPVAGGHRRIGKNVAAKMTYGFANARGVVTCAPKFADATVFEDDLAAVQTDVVLPDTPTSARAEVTLGDEPARLRLTAKQIEWRTRLHARPAIADALREAARDRVALRKLLKEESAQREATIAPFFLLADLGVDAVLTLEVIASVTRRMTYPFTCAEATAALDAIDSRESMFARARVFGTIPEFEHDVGRALRALAPVAVSREDHASRAAQSFAKIEAAHPGAVHALLAKLPAEEAETMRRVAHVHGIDLPEASDAEIPAQLAATTKKKKLPEFWDAHVFARPLTKDCAKALPIRAVDEIAHRLDAGDLDVAATKSACDGDSLREFSWSVFSTWLAQQAPPKQKWAFTMLGDFGDDEIVTRLAPMIAEWPGQSAHARAVSGLAVLQKIGTDAALRAVHRLSRRAKFGGLKGEAERAIAHIAKQRGLTSEELADQLVPDFDLEADGSKLLDFGARSFRVGFDEALSPFVITSDGKRIADLPKPSKTDDKARAADATAFWKNLKKEVRAIASLQIERLENAMAARRKWRASAFRAHFIEHALLQHLARRLVWTTDAGARFRVAEDRSLANDKDDAITIADDDVIAIAHPLDLGKDAIATWSKIFADYELIQPFAQLEREVFTMTAEEEATHTMTRFANVEVRANALVALLTHGWSRGPIEDNGIYFEISNRIATLRFQPGLAVGTSANPNQRLAPITLAPKDAIDPIELSELVVTLTRVKSVE